MTVQSERPTAQPSHQACAPLTAHAQAGAARIGAQGILLFAGFGMAQALSFARNALLGHALSPRDFGIAASITLLLQMLEMLSDLGHDRLIVQAADGERDDFLATTHTILLARGFALIEQLAADSSATDAVAASAVKGMVVAVLREFGQERPDDLHPLLERRRPLTRRHSSPFQKHKAHSR